MLASYEIYCDQNWLTHRVNLERTIGSDVNTLGLSVESRGYGALRIRSCAAFMAVTMLISQ
jgi:hypothetical protein